LRHKLKLALQAQAEPGGIKREIFTNAGITAETCTTAIRAEYALKPKGEIMWPGMPAKARAEVARLAADWRHVRARVAVWTAVKTMLQGNVPVSGRVKIVVKEDRDHGRSTVVRPRSARPVSAAWAELPTLVMSATLPRQEILDVHFPDLVVAADVEAATPHAFVRQVTGAPTSGRKLAKAAIDSLNVRRLHKHIIRRHIEVGRGSTLVVCQKEFQEKLAELGLPDGIAVEHFNAIAGLDGYRAVNHVMLVGRILPPVREVESLAGALTGVEPILVENSKAGLRYALLET
jgi:hypothetical protein